jgi:hypothetical protein
MSSIFDLLHKLSQKYALNLEELMGKIFSSEVFEENESGDSHEQVEKAIAILEKEIQDLEKLLAQKRRIKAELQKKHKESQEQKKYHHRNRQEESYYEKHSNSKSHDKISKAYAALEIPNGSDLDSVKKAYRKLLKKYHPDYYMHDPEKQKIANTLTQKIGDAYNTLVAHLK